MRAFGANLHNERPDLPAADIRMVCEAQKRHHALAQLPGRLHTGPAGRPDDMGRETAILTAADLPVLGHEWQQVSESTGKRLWRVGKERWGHRVLTQPDGWSVLLDAIALHPVAGPKALRSRERDPLDRRYEDAMDWLDAALTASRALGHEAVVYMDAQLPKHIDVPWSPRKVFERHHMSWHWVGIDVLAWTPGLVADNRRTHDITSEDSHVALSVDLSPAKHRRNR